MPYVIRNCPVCEFSDWEECTGYLAEGYICNDIHTKIVECKDCTDCVMKQIVEKCKNTQFLSTKNRLDLYAVKVFANDLLQLLDIQEVE